MKYIHFPGMSEAMLRTIKSLWHSVVVLFDKKKWERERDRQREKKIFFSILINLKEWERCNHRAHIYNDKVVNLRESWMYACAGMYSRSYLASEWVEEKEKKSKKKKCQLIKG